MKAQVELTWTPIREVVNMDIHIIETAEQRSDIPE